MTVPTITPLDPNDPRTWKNIPCPVDLRPIQAELTQVGGLNKFGGPNFIIVWAQEYKTWDCGKMRLHFDEELIPAKQTANRFAVRPELFTRCAEWYEDRLAERRAAYMRLDWAALGQMPDLAVFLRDNAAAGDYFKLPSDDEDLGRTARLMPDGWMYVSGLFDYEHVGEQVFYILQYYPPEAFGDEKAWNSLRFADHYCPETDREEPFVDVTGPFPSKGQYEKPVIRIGKREAIKTKHARLVGVEVDSEIYRFQEPTVADVDKLRELLQIRDSLTEEQKDPTARNEKRRQDFEESAPGRLARWKQVFKEKFWDAAPVGRGNATNISANKTKFNN